MKTINQPLTDAQKQADFNKAVERFGGIITRLCWYYSSRDSEFDDLRQDTLLNLWRGWESFRGASSPQTWIYRVCLNTCVSAIRKSERRAKLVSDQPLPDIAAPDDTEAQAREELHRLLQLLSPTDRAIILLWLESHTYEEIGEIMGLPRNTVATRLRRAKEKLSDMAH